MNKRNGKSYTQELFDDLERAGIIAKSGELRFDRKQRLQPVYVLTELGKDKAAVARALADLSAADDNDLIRVVAHIGGKRGP